MRYRTSPFLRHLIISFSTVIRNWKGFLSKSRTRCALNEKLDVRFATVGPVYEVESESENTYKVDIEAATCTWPGFEQRQPDDGCKHLRRVDLEIRTGLVPAPDGTFSR
ncbi:hypothetical protein SAMN05192552_10616 [Natrinema hispanicum]|uniref:SWIM-type domain-containing protein n=1 Tax=Natrinema hispanicum TaxID=392421 RepID=A0A1G6YAE5_9EURY|nr:hypothetical protein SAMN05192552_10616 [Natrinema hispanicum]SEU09641.1 hypothetical protein SAMN04488694_14310 [Natrinema hispanicum]